MNKLQRTTAAAALLLAAGVSGGCNAINGEFGGNEFGRVRSALYGEIDTDNQDGFQIFLSDYPFSCEDLTQNWTPDEEDAFPALRVMGLFTGDRDEAEFDVEADDSDEGAFAQIEVYDDGLDEEEIFLSTDGTVTIDSWNEGRSVAGVFELTFIDDEGDDYDLDGSFNASFCRNLSAYDD